MSTAKKNTKAPANLEDVQAALQALIAQGKKDGMIRTTELNALLEKMELSTEKMEEIYAIYGVIPTEFTGDFNMRAYDPAYKLLTE